MRLALVLGALGALALPCRYTVRDIGFVELSGPVWQLARVADEGAELGELERESVERALRGSNVRYAPVEAARGARAGEWALLGAGRDPLPLGTRDLSAAQSLSLRSPLRTRFLEQALDTFAFLVLVEGREEEANRAARIQLEEARRGLSALEPQLPRPLGHPLRSLELPWEQRERERVFLWSMGVPLEDARPAALVLYGRGVRAGAPLLGEAITGERVLAWLGLIGESCECDTERDWSAEPALPLSWGLLDNQSLSDALGFDPESPWVQREVASILQRGAWTKPPGDGAQALEQDALAAVLGFRVGGLDGVGEPPAGEARMTSPPGGTLVVRGEGDGDWDFAEEPLATVSGETQPGRLSWPATSERVDVPAAEAPARKNSPSRIGLALGALALVSLGGAVLVALLRLKR